MLPSEKYSTYQAKAKNLQTHKVKSIGPEREHTTDETAIGEFEHFVNTNYKKELDEKTHSFSLIKNKTDIIATIPKESK
jgi:hypothetical protein